METWGSLFERAGRSTVTEDEVVECLSRRREAGEE
jgi:hypothetical protein